MFHPNLSRIISIPGFKPFRVYLHPARRGCEHFCFVGAFTDAAAYLFHVELYQVNLFAKLALAFGAVGVYLTHAEEAIHTGSHTSESDT